MRIVSFLLLNLFITKILVGQNLVPNPGFDELTDCPSGRHQIELAFPWSNANNGTADIFNICATNERFRIPYGSLHNPGGYQPVRSGNGYAGIRVYHNGISAFNTIEYLQAPLTTYLKKDQQYFIDFFISVDLSPSSFWIYTKSIGLAFSDTLYYEEISTGEALSLNPSIEYQGDFIRDTMNWTRISGCYTAKGGEAFIIIGNFKNTADTEVIVEDPRVFPYAQYFFIEDVRVQAFDPLPDTLLLCDGQAEYLDATFLDAAYQWSNGATTPDILVEQEGMLTLEAFMPNCILTDTVIIINTQNLPAWPSDTLICQDQTLSLRPPISGQYLWQDGSTLPSFTASQAGNYSCTVNTPCGPFDFSTTIETKDCQCNIFVPNIFTPNEDGVNDHFEIFVECDFDFQLLSFHVFDRWGNLVYQVGAGQNVRWDGRTDGKRLNEGVYMWQMNFRQNSEGNQLEKRDFGTVTIIR